MTQQYTQQERVTKRDDVIRKIKACLARAKDGSGASPAEAATAARQAEALMRKYNLEMREVIAEDLNDPNNITWAYVRSNMFKNNKAYIKDVQEWAQWIAVECGKLYDCKVALRRVPTEGMVVSFFGYKMDVDVCCWVYDYLLDCCRRASLQIKPEHVPAYELERLRKEPPRLWTPISKYRAIFREGMATELARRLAEAVEAKNSAITSTGTSLIVSKGSAIIAKFGEFGTRQTEKKADVFSSAFQKGLREGKKVHLTPNPIDKKPEYDREKEKLEAHHCAKCRCNVKGSEAATCPERDCEARKHFRRLALENKAAQS